MTQSTKTARSQRGQLIIGGTAMMVLMSMIFFGLLLVLLNTAAISNNSSKLQGIASEAAGLIAAKKWFLGMERKEWDQVKAESEAQESVTKSLAAIGLPPPSQFRVKFIRGTVRDTQVVVTKVSFNVSGLQIVSGGILGNVVPSIHISGLATDSEHAVTKHAMALILAVDPSNPRIRRGIRVPIYNATNGQGQPLNGTVLKAGRSAGSFPEAMLNLNCPQSSIIY